MVWTVRYRDGNGEFRDEAFEAASRSALFDLLAQKGISATRVTEGGPRPARRRSAGAAKAMVAAAVVAAVAAAIVALLLATRGRGGGGGKVGEKAPAAKVEDRKPTKAGGGEAADRSAAPKGKPLPRTRKDIAPPAPLEDILAEAAEKQGQGEDVEVKEPPKPMFRPGTEQIISMAIPSEPGAGVPPIPFPEGADYTEDVRKSMQSAIAAEEGDDEATLERKIQVVEHKQELGELAKEGWTLQEYANAIREKYLLANDFLAECHEVVEKAYADAEISDEAYISLRDDVNAKLREQGLPEITSIEEQLAGESGDGERSADKR